MIGSTLTERGVMMYHADQVFVVGDRGQTVVECMDRKHVNSVICW